MKPRKPIPRKRAKPRTSKGLFKKFKRDSKAEEWEKVRQELKKEFAELGITFCELNYEGCWVVSALGFAHKYKRRNIKDIEGLKVVILCCNQCHHKIEILGEDKMSLIVQNVIDKRNGKNY